MDNMGLGVGGKSAGIMPEFYEFEPAVVLDVILDKDHPYFQKNVIDVGNWLPDASGNAPAPDDRDYTWIGRVLIRMVNSQRTIQKEDLIWALPMEGSIVEYPLLNEIVAVTKYMNKYYYTRKIGVFNLPNNNADFNIERTTGGYIDGDIRFGKRGGNREYVDANNPNYTDFKGPLSKTRIKGGPGYEGVLGRYFLYNDRIRQLKRREGDLIIESRFGQSIRFAAYDDDRSKDQGAPDNFDYYRSGISNPYTGQPAGCGNPMILIRNRQRPLTPPGKSSPAIGKLPAVQGTDAEKNVGGHITEDINNDGSSIHITSGATVSPFVTNCYKTLWEAGSFPQLVGDQIVINSDRIIVSSRRGETFHYSKKRYSVITDDQCTIDAHGQIVLTTNTKTVVNSPAIYLGDYDETNEPVLLGQTTVNWLYDLCEWLKLHTHWYKHWHPDAGGAIPNKTQTPIEVAQLTALQQRLALIMSRRVFVVGGGFAPGKNGESIPNGTDPVKVSIPSGNGLPGGWKGKNRR
jgi:hypothetical protein